MRGVLLPRVSTCLHNKRIPGAQQKQNQPIFLVFLPGKMPQITCACTCRWWVAPPKPPRPLIPATQTSSHTDTPSAAHICTLMRIGVRLRFGLSVRLTPSRSLRPPRSNSAASVRSRSISFNHHYIIYIYIYWSLCHQRASRYKDSYKNYLYILA